MDEVVVVLPANRAFDLGFHLLKYLLFLTKLFAMPFSNTVLFNLPSSYAERLALEDEIRIPATFEEYLDFAEQADYKVEYSNGKIVTMGQPTDAHEMIVFNIGLAFSSLFNEDGSYQGYGSNLGIYIPQTGAHYKPDASILNTAPELVQHRVRKRTLKSVTNPFAVMEVFSGGTMDYDMTEKLPNYKQCESLKYIIYVYQNKPFVTVYTRTEDPNAWLNSDYMGLDASFQFEGFDVKLASLYRNVLFPAKTKKAKTKK